MKCLTFDNVKRLKRGFCIYKIYDSGRKVLYVGGTAAPSRRLQDYVYASNDKANKALVRRGVYFDARHVRAGKTALLGREKRIITASRPRFNIYKKRPKIREIGKRNPGATPWYDVDIL